MGLAACEPHIATYAQTLPATGGWWRLSSTGMGRRPWPSQSLGPSFTREALSVRIVDSVLRCHGGGWLGCVVIRYVHGTRYKPLLLRWCCAGDDSYDFRSKQIQKRVGEVSHTLDMLQHFNEGNVCVQVLAVLAASEIADT